MQIALYDLPDDYFAQYVPRVEAITAAEATAAAARHLDPSRLVTLAVGDLDAIGPGLSQLDLGEPVILSAEAF
jgi:predicted Zn-dependent peptidase